MLDELAVITRPGAPSRRGETESTAAALRDYRRLVAIEEPGTLDGGDVLVAGKTVFVGVGARSNADGVRQLALPPGAIRLRRARRRSGGLPPPEVGRHARLGVVGPRQPGVRRPAGVRAARAGARSRRRSPPPPTPCSSAACVIYSPAYPRTARHSRTPRRASRPGRPRRTGEGRGRADVLQHHLRPASRLRLTAQGSRLKTQNSRLKLSLCLMRSS